MECNRNCELSVLHDTMTAGAPTADIIFSFTANAELPSRISRGYDENTIIVVRYAKENLNCCTGV